MKGALRGRFQSHFLKKPGALNKQRDFLLYRITAVLTLYISVAPQCEMTPGSMRRAGVSPDRTGMG
jgi:hypothetical protein